MRVSAKSMVAKEALEVALRPLLQAAGVSKGEVRLDGSAVGKAFTLRALSGGLRAPEDTIRSILDARRLPSGEWRSIEVRAPSGATVAIYTDPDRSIKQRRIGWHVAAVLRIFKERYPSEQFVAAEAAGAVTCRRETLITFSFDAGTNEVATEWHDEVLERLKMDKSKLAAALAAKIAE